MTKPFLFVVEDDPKLREIITIGPTKESSLSRRFTSFPAAN